MATDQEEVLSEDDLEVINAAAWDLIAAAEAKRAMVDAPGRYATADEYYGG